jgi:hypothetical protein
MSANRSKADLCLRAVVVVGAAAVALFAASLSASAPAQAAICKPSHIVAESVILNNKDAAKHNARWAWGNKVAGLYGPGWRHWSNAKGKDRKCFKAGNGFRCVATAKPCL